MLSRGHVSHVMQRLSQLGSHVSEATLQASGSSRTSRLQAFGAAQLTQCKMRNGKGSVRAPVLQFTNCRILRGRRLPRWCVAPVGAGPVTAGVGLAGAGVQRCAVGGGVLVRRSESRPLSIRREDLWVREGHIVDPEKLFFEERLVADQQRDCGGCILAPGFIDVQINGGVLGPEVETQGRGSEHCAISSFLWPQVDLALTSLRPHRTWVRE